MSTDLHSLFRQEAVEGQRQKLFGDVRLDGIRNLWIIILGLAIIFVLLVHFITSLGNKQNYDVTAVAYPTGHEETIKSKSGLYIEEVLVKVGDYVSHQQPILRVRYDSQAHKVQEIVAPKSGHIGEINVSQNRHVDVENPLVQIIQGRDEVLIELSTNEGFVLFDENIVEAVLTLKLESNFQVNVEITRSSASPPTTKDTNLYFIRVAKQQLPADLPLFVDMMATVSTKELSLLP